MFLKTAGSYFWTSGNDLNETGVYFWQSTGKRMLTHASWWFKGNPDHRKIDGVVQHCIHVAIISQYQAQTLDSETGVFLVDSVCNLDMQSLCEEDVDKERIISQPEEFFKSHT